MKKSYESLDNADQVKGWITSRIERINKLTGGCYARQIFDLDEAKLLARLSAELLGATEYLKSLGG